MTWTTAFFQATFAIITPAASAASAFRRGGACRFGPARLTRDRRFVAENLYLRDAAIKLFAFFQQSCKQLLIKPKGFGFHC